MKISSRSYRIIINNCDIYFIYDIFNRQAINISHHVYLLVRTRCSKPSEYLPWYIARPHELLEPYTSTISNFILCGVHNSR